MRPVAISLTAILTAALLILGGMAVAPRHALPASAQSATGTITGQVVWGAPVPIIYGVPGQSGTAEGIPAPSEVVPAPPAEDLPEPSVEEMPEAMPGMAPEGFARPIPGPIIRPPVYRPIPAGAVVVAIQGTNISTKTDENGNFTLENVPSDQYWTVAAGPVGRISTAFVLRPNVIVKDGVTTRLGRLYLGQSYQYGYGPVPYGAEAPNASPDEAPE